MKQPCKQDCPERSADCHIHCERWAEWERYKKQEYARRDQENVMKYYMCALSAKIKHKKSRRTK